MGGAVTLTNEAGASIGGGTNGVTMRAGGTVTNQSGAAIQGDTDGVLMQDGGSVTNRSGATIAGATRGVESFGGTILNTGSGSSITSDITGLQTFAGGGSITNADGATIRGGQNGVLMDSSTALTNQSGGQIVGAADMGVQSFNGGSVTNTDDGTLIQGAVYGIDLQGGTGTVTNRGGASIKGGSVGLFMDSGGTLTNSGNGSTISGQDNGVYITGGTGSVTNENGATVGSAGSTGVWLDATDGTVTNTGAGSTISGDYGVLFTGTAGTVNNQDGASITGSTVGVYLDGGGSVINGAGSTLSGTAYGLYVGSGETTLSNAGTIAGDVRLADNRTNRVTLTTGGRITGELYIGTESTSTLTLDGTGSQVYSQAVTGGTTFVGGVLTKQGSGTWIIDVAADAGLGFEPSGTVIDAGVLQIGSGGTAGSISGDITNNATLAFDRSNASTYSGAISGPGNVLKAGAGTLTLTASSTYTGDTTVEAGRLAVNGSIAGSAVTVLNGATLGGTGAVGPVTVQTGGTIGAGNSIGTLTVAGNYTQAAGSFLQAEFNAAGQADRINVNGTVTLSGGTVQALPAPGSYARTTTYTILNATGGVVGTFAGVTSSSAAVRPTLTYDGNNVFLTLLRTVSSFSTAAQTPNQQAVGATLDRANATAAGDFGSVLDALWLLDPTQTGTALNAISGQNYAGFTNLEVLRAQIFMTNFAQQAGSGSAGGQRVALAEACDVACDTAQEARWGASAGGLGGAGTVAGNANSSGLAYSLGGVAFGIDHRFDRHLIVGLTSGYTAAGLSTETMPGRGSSDTTHVGLYARWTENVFYLDGLAGYARSDNHMQRTILMPGLQPRTAHSHTHSDQFFGQLESGYKVELGGVMEASLTPFGRLQASTSTIAAFTEWGADSLDLDVAAQNVSSLRTIAGAQIAGKLDLGSGSKVNAALRLGWSHEFADVARPVTASFAGAPVDPVHDTRCRGTARWRDRRPGARHRHG
jgi:autotransporter-associated beta strand protein